MAAMCKCGPASHCPCPSSSWLSLASVVMLLITLVFTRRVTGCVHLMGDSPDSEVVPAAGATHWSYGFRGDDWEGVTANKTWLCPTGRAQTPIDLHPKSKSVLQGNASLATTWVYNTATSNGSDIQVYNNGHTIQVQWAPGTVKSEVMVPAAGGNVLDVVDAQGNKTSMYKPADFKRVPATPLQYHFHTSSEHVVDGVYYEMELHIVHRVDQADLAGCPETGCLMVTGILYKLDPEDKDNAALADIWDVMPMREGVMVDLEKGVKLDIDALLPKDRSYLQYSGSLTTPPCTEGLLWHVFTTPQTMSLDQLRKYSKAVGLKDCKLNDTSASAASNGHHGHRRMLAAHTAPGTEQPSQLFVPGSLSGFVRMPTQHVRRSLAEGGGNDTHTPDDWVCKVVSYGFTNRNIQPLNGRPVIGY